MATAADYRIDYISDWVTRIKNRLYVQWRYSESWNKWATAIGEHAQDLEDAVQSLLALADIDVQEGVNLDVIGRIVGQPRTTTDDVTYRTYIKARIATNRSTGVTADLYSVLRGLLGDSVSLVYSLGGVKQFVIRIVGAIAETQAGASVDFLGDATEAGARGILEFQESATASLFTLDIGPGFGTGVLADARRI